MTRRNRDVLDVMAEVGFRMMMDRSEQVELLRAALRGHLCPANCERTVAACVDGAHCGCDNGPALVPGYQPGVPGGRSRPGRDASGLGVGTRIITLVETSGEDHEGNQHVLPAGSTGHIESIDWLGSPEGTAYTVWIDVDPAKPGDRGIVNVFDAGDGPIGDFIQAAPAAAQATPRGSES